MSDNYTVRNASGASLTKRTTEVSSGIHADHVIPVDASDNVTPAGDTVGRARFGKITDGTDTLAVEAVNAALDEAAVTSARAAAHLFGLDAGASANSKAVPLQIAGATKLAAYTTSGTLAVTPSGQQSAYDSIVTGTTTPSATVAAAGSGIKYVVRHICISLACTLDQVPLLFKLTQDKAGTPVVLWQGTLAGLAKTSRDIVLDNLCIPQTVANKTLHLEVTAGTIVSTNYIAVGFGVSQAA